MKIAGIVLVLISLFIIVGSVHALNINPTSFTLVGGRISYVNITFYNNQNVTDNISINYQNAEITYGYYFSAIGVKPASFTIAPGQSKQILFSFSTNDVFFSSPVQIQMPYTLNGNTESFTLNIPIIPESQSLVYISTISAPKSIFPSNNLKFNVTVVNGLSQTGVRIPFYYNLSENGIIFSGNKTVTLDSLGTNVISLSLPINTSAPPGNYTLKASLVYIGNSSSLSSPVFIKPYSSFSRSVTNSFNAFGGTGTLTITNTGNENIPASNISLRPGGINSVFITSAKSSIGTAKISNGAVIPSIPYLMPGQTIVLSYSSSYVPIYIIVVVIILAIVLVLYLNRKVVIRKEVIEHKSVDGFIDVKIALRVRNVSSRPVSDIEVEDQIPENSLKVSNSGQKEGKISKVNGSLKISWKEKDLNPKDEVILMYEIKSKIGIIGKMTLKPASAKFSYNGKHYGRRSNSLILNIK